MHIQESGQMYLETIYVLSKTKNLVRAIDVCEQMGYSKPSVSRAMGILKKESLISIDPSGHIALTDKGRAIAESMYERHTLLSSFLESIGVNSEIAAEDACRIEHCISEESFEAIKKFTENSGRNGEKQ
ncbi:MAG: metal-dependent transcriptional regulator [Clostridia bacterium]|nr:metal-dependent transcriptional regulator [Clostridia bacterium]